VEGDRYFCNSIAEREKEREEGKITTKYSGLLILGIHVNYPRIDS
jgi:hypothetical protein